MKDSLFFAGTDYKITQQISKKVADFFSMRLFDSIEMFEFDNAPRKIDEVITDFGIGYVKKEMRSTIKMSLEFEDSVVVADLAYVRDYENLHKKIKEKNLVIFLYDKNDILSDNIKLAKLMFLTSLCDIAINVSNVSKEEIFEKVIKEIKDFFKIEVQDE